MVKLLTSDVDAEVREQFKQALDKKNFNKDDLAAGREYVDAYVTFIHSVERLYEAAKHPAHGHYEEAGAEEAH